MSNKIVRKWVFLPIIALLLAACSAGHIEEGVTSPNQVTAPVFNDEPSVTVNISRPAENIEPLSHSPVSTTSVPTLSDSEAIAITSSIDDDNDYFCEKYALGAIAGNESQDILVAVLDTGISEKHADLDDKVMASVNFTLSPTTDDRHGHGTHIAGIINSLAPNSRFLNVKVANDYGSCNAEAVAKGIIWAVDNGAKIINLSVTLIEPSQSLEHAIDYAWDKGVVLVAAAGNSGNSNPLYPAYYENCLAVTATNGDSLALLANYGDWVDVAAPGTNVYSTLPNNEYGYKTGTSMATAYVSGLAGVIFPNVFDMNGDGLLNDEVRRIIEGSCVHVDTLDVNSGWVDISQVAPLLASIK